MPIKNVGDIGFYYDFYTNTLRFHRYFNEFFADSGIFIDIVFQIPPIYPVILFSLNQFTPFSVI